jgi:hypothetical protein
MKKRISFSRVLTNLMLALCVGLACIAAIPNEPVLGLALGAGVFTIGTIMPIGVYVFTGHQISYGNYGLNMAVQKEIWVDYIIKNLFKDNSFLNFAHSDDQFVLAGKVVHIPQIGAKPTVIKNRGTFPATAVRRTDTDITYALDEFTTDPEHIQDAEKVELSYDKIESVFGEHLESLRERIADEMLYNWRVTSSGQIIRTTGGAVTAHLDSATGNRKLFDKSDLRAARKLMNKQNISKVDRYALVSSEMMDQLQSDVDLIKRDYAQELDMKNGVIMRLFGFELIERSNTLVYTNAGTPVPKAVAAAAAATDNDAVICWQKNAVSRAMGEVKFFDDTDNPLYYGDIYSALVRMGGRQRRTNGEGIVAIVQAASA